MQTKLVRVDLSQYELTNIDPQNPSPVEQHVNNLCANQDLAGFRLVSTFVFQLNLVLIFQKPDSAKNKCGKASVA